MSSKKKHKHKHGPSPEDIKARKEEQLHKAETFKRSFIVMMVVVVAVIVYLQVM